MQHVLPYKGEVRRGQEFLLIVQVHSSLLIFGLDLLWDLTIDGHRAVPAWRGVVPHRATVPAVPCLWRARAWPPAQGTARGPFGRAVPPVGHDHFHRAVPAHSPAAKITKSLRTWSFSTWFYHQIHNSEIQNHQIHIRFKTHILRILNHRIHISQSQFKLTRHKSQTHNSEHKDKGQKTRLYHYMNMSCFVQCCLIKNISR